MNKSLALEMNSFSRCSEDPDNASAGDWYNYFYNRMESGENFNKLWLEFTNAAEAMKNLENEGKAVKISKKSGKDKIVFYVSKKYAHCP